MIIMIIYNNYLTIIKKTINHFTIILFFKFLCNNQTYKLPSTRSCDSLEVQLQFRATDSFRGVCNIFLQFRHKDP